MVHASTVCMGSLLFCMGLLLGLIFHLPGASSPSEARTGDKFAARGAIRSRRGLPGQRILINGTLPAGEPRIKSGSSGDHADADHVTRPSGIAANDGRQRAEPSSDNTQARFGVIDAVFLSESDSTNSGRSSGGFRVVDTDNTAVGQRPGDIQAVTESRHLDESHQPPTNVTRSVNVVLGSKQDAPSNSRQDTGRENADAREQSPATGDGPPSSSPDGATSSGYIADGIYWSGLAESVAPAGLGDKDVSDWRTLVDGSQVVAMSPGCGRMQNRQLVLDDATKACARYRLNTDQMQGEIYCFYLARVLGIRNVLPSILLLPSPRDDRWRRVHLSLAAAQWAPDRVVVVTPWMKDLEVEYIPEELRTDPGFLHPTEAIVAGWTQDKIRRLVQWSDLIVFDYLTANLDRVVNNMYNHQWNPDMMNSPTHNLERTPDSEMLVFLDNESGLFHSYRLLDKYNHYHQSLLKSLCVFRKSTANAIRQFVDSGDIGAAIMALFQNEEPLHRHVHRIPDRTMEILNQRIQDVNNQILWCKSRYGR